MFYHYSQNNSGGSFVFDEVRGITHHVVIEATDPYQADARAEDIGLYFDGYGDCPCCGDRWYSTSKYDSEEFPHVYGTHVNERDTSFNWMPDGKEVVVHYLNGKMEWYK